MSGRRRQVAARLAPAAVALATLTIVALAFPPRRAGAEECAGLTADVAAGEVEVVGAKVSATGTWKSAAGTDAALLEIRIDGDRYAVRTVLGGGAAWSFETVLRRELTNFCGAHLLQVYVYPTYRDGAELNHCLTGAALVTRRFAVDCAPVAVIDRCDLRCAPGAGGAASVCSGTCTGRSGGGIAVPPYQPLWSDGRSSVLGEVGAGPWTQPIACLAGSTVTLKLRDRAGVGLLSAAATHVCGASPDAEQPGAPYHPGVASTGRLELRLVPDPPRSAPD